jgi:hypothetical protein
MWAPDISVINGRYHLYYALSTLGDNRSATGLYTNATPDPYAWKDEGLAFASHEHEDYNCIDPQLRRHRSGGRQAAHPAHPLDTGRLAHCQALSRGGFRRPVPALAARTPR